MKLLVFKTGKITAELKKKKDALDAICFEIPDLTEHKNKYYRDPAYRLVLIEDDQLISYLEIYNIETTWQGQGLKIAGIGSVMTDPNFRGRGVAKGLLAESLEIMKVDNYDLGLLQTNVEKGQNLYGSIGFVPLNRPVAFTCRDGREDIIKAKDTMILPLANPELTANITNSTDTLHIGAGSF